MSVVTDRAICLRLNDFSETSQVVTLFTRRFGRVKMIAKGSRRRTKAGASAFDGGLDVLDAGEAVFRHKPEADLSLLTAWKLTDGHLGLRRSLRPIHLGLYAAELVDRLIEEHDAHPGLFDAFARLLDDLATPAAEEAFLAFQVDLLRETGDLPELAACTRCGQVPGPGERRWFSPTEGGVLCVICQGRVGTRFEVDPRLLRLIRGLSRLPRDPSQRELPRLARPQTDPANRLLADHVEHTLGAAMRMPDYVLRRDRSYDVGPGSPAASVGISRDASHADSTPSPAPATESLR